MAGAPADPRRAEGLEDLRPQEQYRIPVELRPELARPWGVVVDSATLAAMLQPGDEVLAVGDIVSITLQDIGIVPRLFVCDYRTQRGEDRELRRRLGSWGDREVRVDNPAATITRQAWDAVRQALSLPGTTRIVVEGEEDLLGIPCFLEAPDGAIVVYGMPGRGAVVCLVTPTLRAKVASLVATMTQA